MAKNNQKEEYVTEEVLQNLDSLAKSSESFVEKYSKIITIALGAVLLAVIAYIAYLNFVVEPNEKEATKQMLSAQKLLQEGKTDEALGGANAGNDGFIETANKFSGTAAGKISAYYAGTIEYEKGNYQKALELFQKFDSNDDIANSIKLGAIADCYVQLGKNDEALSHYDKAVSEADNAGAKVAFLKKAGILAMSMNKNKEAYNYFNTIIENHPDVDTTGEVEMYLERLAQQNGNG